MQYKQTVPACTRACVANQAGCMHLGWCRGGFACSQGCGLSHGLPTQAPYTSVCLGVNTLAPYAVLSRGYLGGHQHLGHQPVAARSRRMGGSMGLLGHPTTDDLKLPHSTRELHVALEDCEGQHSGHGRRLPESSLTWPRCRCTAADVPASGASFPQAALDDQAIPYGMACRHH
jgi:hypothetical protein